MDHADAGADTKELIAELHGLGDDIQQLLAEGLYGLIILADQQRKLIATDTGHIEMLGRQ